MTEGSGWATVSEGAFERLSQAGLRLTPQRQAVLKTLAEGGHPTAEELYRTLREKGVAMATLYRTLRLLLRLGLVRQVHVRDGCVRYELIGESHCHFVCLSCGRVFDADSPEAQAGERRRKDFVVMDSDICLFGYCAACSQKEGRTKGWKDDSRVESEVRAREAAVPSRS
ncbi:MAG TPA: transcriptional repressor [Firmicutes bacterium]|nr:transcriptional repressor [Bacillota bacterium]